MRVQCPSCLSNDVIFVRAYRAALPGSEPVFSGLSIWGCQTCAVKFAHPTPDKELLANYYATHYRGEESWHRLTGEPGPWDGGYVRARSQFEFVSRRVKGLVNNNLITSWLDIGAGYGCLLDEAKQQGIEKTGAIEPDEHSRARLTMQGHHSYEHLSTVKGAWDVISLSHLLEHLASPPKFLRQLKHILSENGYIFCEVPNELRLQDASNDAPHLAFFVLPSLSQLFKNSGFDVLAVQTCGKMVRRQGWDTLSSTSRRVATRLFHSPPTWLDVAIHPHFHYSHKGDRTWIRLLACKIHK